MRASWNARARDDPFYFVDTRQRYREPDLDRFFAEGERDLDYLFDRLGAAIGPSDTVLDLGCGVGRMTRPLARRAHRVVAIDVSDAMLERARELNPALHNVDWRRGDGSSLAGVPDASVDACLSIVVFHHIPDPETTLHYVCEIGRVLRSGGWAAIQVSDDPSMHRPRGGLNRRLRALIGRGEDDPAWLGAPTDLAALRRAAEEAGLQVENSFGEGTQFCCVMLRKSASP